MVNVLIWISLCVALGGLATFTWSIHLSGAKKSADVEERKRKEEQVLLVEAIGKLLMIAGCVGEIAAAVINRYLIG